MTTLTTRRALLAVAAAVPTLALPAAVAVALPAAEAPIAPPIFNQDGKDDPVFALAERAKQAHEAHGAACIAINKPEGAFFDWRRNNPAPDENDFRAPQEAKAAMSRWRRRQSAARRRTGFAEAEANQDDACDASWKATQALAAAAPLTFAGLAAKASAWRYLHGEIKEQVDDVVYSLARDISVMAGEVDVPDIQADE